MTFNFYDNLIISIGIFLHKYMSGSYFLSYCSCKFAYLCNFYCISKFFFFFSFIRFIYTCLGVGIAVCLSTLSGCMVANCISNYTLCIVSSLGNLIFIFFLMAWLFSLQASFLTIKIISLRTFVLGGELEVKTCLLGIIS